MTKSLKNIYTNCQFKQKIRTSTRVTDKTSTLIDHLATNRPSHIIKSGIVITGISDHDMVYGMRKISCKTNNAPKIIKSRQLKNYNKDLFKKDLANAYWESIMEIKNIHDMFFE